MKVSMNPDMFESVTDPLLIEMNDQVKGLGEARATFHLAI